VDLCGSLWLRGKKQIQFVDKTSVVRDHVPTFSIEQLTRLLLAASPEYLPVLAIAAFAGLRQEEITKLKWEDLDFDERTIRVNASAAKTRKKRLAEISDNLKAWLQPYAGRTGPVAPPNLQKLRRATMKLAKIENGRRTYYAIRLRVRITLSTGIQHARRS
jgi:integrase